MAGARRIIVAGVAAALVSAGAAPAMGHGATVRVDAPEPRGAVTYVVDGDTIHVRLGGRTEKVRLIGVDTPELPRGCFAAQAKAETARLVAGKVVALRADRTQADRDAYGRLLRHVVLADRTLLAHRLISAGLGREYTYARPYIGQPTFRNAQARAITAKRNIWSARCATSAPRPLTTTRPAPSTRPAPTKPAPVTNRCVIKGNISSSGERIYHVPGQRHYAQTVVTLTKGEKWFCSESAAVKAGWRRAKV